MQGLKTVINSKNKNHWQRIVMVGLWALKPLNLWFSEPIFGYKISPYESGIPTLLLFCFIYLFWVWGWGKEKKEYLNLKKSTNKPSLIFFFQWTQVVPNINNATQSPEAWSNDQEEEQDKEEDP